MLQSKSAKNFCKNELARLEHELNKPKNWGEITFHNLRKRELESNIKEPNVTPNSAVREALEANPTVTGPLDASVVIKELNENDQCDFFSRYPKCKIFVANYWDYFSTTVLRHISIEFAENLLEIDFSHSSVSSLHLEIILVRSTNIKVLRLNNCNDLDVSCMNIIAKLSSFTLTELYVNSCHHFKVEPLLCIGGCSGFKAPSLSKLISLDLGECPVQDEGVLGVVHGCKRIKFLNLQNGINLTDASIVPLVKSMKKLHLLNLNGCIKITNKVAIAIGKNCLELVSLNLSRCANITDVGVKVISSGCIHLQAVNLSGLAKISEDSMFSLATNCKGLLMLNLTGCERITFNGLNNLILGMKYVDKGISFTGFKPKDAMIEKKLQGQLQFLHDEAANLIKEQQISRARQIAKETEIRELRIRTAAICIQNYMYRYKLRMHFYRLWRKRVLRESVATVQRVYRGYRGRLHAEEVREQRRLFLSSTPYAIYVQRCVRGYLCRIHHLYVSKAIRSMYLSRRQEVENAIAVRLQSHCRRFLASLRVKAVAELRMRRNQNRNSAILIMQQLVRRFEARLCIWRKRRAKVSMEQARYNAGMKIKVFCVDGMRRYKSRLSGDELKRFFRHKWAAATIIQKIYRGYRTREMVHKYNIHRATQYYAASQIQRIYRGTRILHWRDLRLNFIAAFCLDRHYLERKNSVAASRLRYKQYVAENQRDSASEPDDDDEMEIIWTKGYDAKRKLDYWTNFTTNEITYDEPPAKLAHEKALINKRIKVYWVVQSAWYEGTITRYHKRKRRHRVEYDDGDHEWINLEQECDRVQIQLDDGLWSMYLMYQSDAMKEEWRKIEDKHERENYQKQAFEDAAQWKIFVDDVSGQMMFISTKTGELRGGAPGAENWIIEDDGYGFPCFINTVTQATQFEDPRFLYDVEEDLSMQRKYVMQELRFALYFCKDFYEKYQIALEKEDQKTLNALILAVRNSPKPIHLNSFIIRAKSLYQTVSVVDKPMDQQIWDELEYAGWMAEQMAEITNQAEDFLLKRRDKKREIVAKITEKSGMKVFCRYCKRETRRELEYCPTCGKVQVFMD